MPADRERLRIGEHAAVRAHDREIVREERVRVVVQKLQTRGGLARVGPGGDHERVLSVGEAGRVDKRVSLAGERPAQDRLDDVRVENVWRALQQRRRQHLHALPDLRDLDPEADPPLALGVRDRARLAVWRRAVCRRPVAVSRCGRSADVAVR